VVRCLAAPGRPRARLHRIPGTDVLPARLATCPRQAQQPLGSSPSLGPVSPPPGRVGPPGPEGRRHATRDPAADHHYRVAGAVPPARPPPPVATSAGEVTLAERGHRRG